MTLQWQGRSVLVTGATGMTGLVLVEKLLSLGASVRATSRGTGRPASWRSRPNLSVIDGDLADPATGRAALAGVDELIHLASCRRNVSVHHDRAGSIAQANVAMTMALLSAMDPARPIPVTFFSTANITAALDPLVLQRQPAIDGYVAGKYAAELLWLAAAREHGFPLLVLRPVGIYGPGDTFADDGNVIPSLMVRSAHANDSLQIWGSGQQERSFIFVEDVAGALLRLRQQGAEGIQYLSPPERTTVAALAGRIRDLMKPGLRLEFDSSRPEGLRSPAPQPMHECLADYPWTSLDDGLRRTAAAWTGSR